MEGMLMHTVAGDQVAATLPQAPSPRRRKCNLETKTPTLMDIWINGGHLHTESTMKKELSPVATFVDQEQSSCVLPTMEKINSQMSPVVFDFATTSQGKRAAKEDKVDETLILRRWLETDTKMEKKMVNSCARTIGTQVDNLQWKNATDVIVAETQLETVKQEQQTLLQRQSSTDTVTIVNDMQVKSGQKRRLQSTVVQASTTRVKAEEPMLLTLTPYTRRRSVTTDVVSNYSASKTLRKGAVSDRKAAHLNVAPNTSSVAIDSQTLHDIEHEAFHVGDVVEVIERQWVGINKQGGAARITNVHGDGFYAVKFVIGGKDNRVPGSFIRLPADELISDSTPSRSAKTRQRRRVSDKMTTRDHLDTEAVGTTDSMKTKTKMPLKTNRKHSGMVFLCSGFKERRMQQIIEWAELLGAKVVQYWSNDVTHLIAKCVCKDDTEDKDPSMEDSDSTSLSQSHQNGKRKVFGELKSGRWVKIRSLKYLKALVGGRWIVSDEWLQACADHGGYVKEVSYEANGYWKGWRILDAVKRSRLTREKLLHRSLSDIDRSTIGTMLFADFCFHIIGEFLPPMPSAIELKTLICIGGGKVIALAPDEMHMRKNHARKLIVVSDKINPIALRQQTRQLKAQPPMKVISSAIIVSYLWVINSISEANLRELPSF
ncbi:unnamed protein product [Peronospora belbahrii]|nr:unnamed protein product [Peronospora belbahrii]